MSEPLTKRHRAFCARVIAGENLSDSWAGSALDVGKEPGSAASSSVSGSRMAARYADYIAAGKMERASESAPLEDLNLEDVSAIMSEISDVLIESAMVAESSGHVQLSASLRSGALLHHNRSARVQRVQGDTPDKVEAYDANAALERILCQCR